MLTYVITDIIKTILESYLKKELTLKLSMHE